MPSAGPIETPEPKEKVLYVGDGVSWDTQWAHAVDMYQLDYSVWLHDHGRGDRCRLDGAHCRCGRLTGTTDTPTLDLVTPRTVEN